MQYKGIDITIEYPRGSFKEDKSSSIRGMGWFMEADYGYIKNTLSMEPGEELDVFIGAFDSDMVHMCSIEPSDPDGISEVKVLLGFISQKDVMNFMEQQYWGMKMGPVTCMMIEDFKTDLEQGKIAAAKDKEWVKESTQAQEGKTTIEKQEEE